MRVLCGGGGRANYLSRSLHTLCLLLSMSRIKQWAYILSGWFRGGMEGGEKWEWKRTEKSLPFAQNVKGAPVMRDRQFKPIPLFAPRDPFAKLWRICVVTDCSSNSTQRLSPTHHLLIEFFKCTLTPYYCRQRCRMNSPLFLNANLVRVTYILVDL